MLEGRDEKATFPGARSSRPISPPLGKEGREWCVVTTFTISEAGKLPNVP